MKPDSIEPPPLQCRFRFRLSSIAAIKMSTTSTPAPYSGQLPVDLRQLIELVCVDRFAWRLTHSSVNCLLTSSSGADGAPASIRVQLDSAEDRTCWGMLPNDWREYFDSVPVDRRDEALRLLSVGECGVSGFSARIACLRKPRRA